MTTTTPPAKATIREWIGLAVLALACLLYVMDLTVLHLAVPAMSADLQPSSTQLLWIIDIYGFLVAGSLITMGTLGDRIGRRRLLLIGAALFGAVSLLAAFSVSAEMLIVSRALLGIAGATIAPSTMSLIFHMFTDERQRRVAIGIWIGSFSAGSAIGPVLGGIMLEFFWWGSVFLLALPVMAALLILGPRVLPEYRDPTAGRLDLLSAGLSVAAILAVIYGVKELAVAGLVASSIVPILIGLAVGAVWFRRQTRLKDPMVDVRLFRIPTFNAALTTNFLSIFVMSGYFLFVAQYLQLVVGLSPLEAGLWSLPSAASFVGASQLTAWIVAKVRPGRIISGGLLIAAVGLLMLFSVGTTDGLALLIAASVVMSVGLAPVFGLTTELIVGSAPPERAGAATGISETGSELGGALGIAVMGSVGVAVYRSQLTETVGSSVPADAMAVARDTLGAAVAVAGELPTATGQALLSAAHEAFVGGMHVTALIAAIGAVGVAVMAHIVLRSQGIPGSPAEAGSAEGPDGPGASEASEPAGSSEHVPHAAPTRLGATDA
jgi:DHA2 family multidrug resistance protein-like MFS transporter